MIAVKVVPKEFFLADDMRIWTVVLFSIAVAVTIATVVSAYRDYRAVRDPSFAVDGPAKLTTAMVLLQETLMLFACICLLAASALRLVAAAPEPGLSVWQSVLYCIAAAFLAFKSVMVNRYRARILDEVSWDGAERRAE